MRNVRISVVCLLWLGVWLPGVQTASGRKTVRAYVVIASEWALARRSYR